MNIVLQHFDGDLRPLDYASMANMKAYAKMVGADYELVKAGRSENTLPVHARKCTC